MIGFEESGTAVENKVMLRRGPIVWTLGAAASLAGRWRPICAAELVLEALNMALWQRQPEAVIHHSDQGCQYTSIAFGLRCRKAGVRLVRRW